MPAASSRSASSPATGSRWSPRPAPNSPPASSARSMPARGRCRCRCRPASAGARPMSSSSECSSNSSDPALFLYPGRARRFRPGRGRQARASPRATGNRWPRSSPPAASCPTAHRRRHRLSAIFERLDPLPARRRGHSPRAARQSPRPRRRPRDRGRPTACIRWLPWYHDMGLVGCLLSPVANQMSVDYLKTEDFARRPLAWLDLITRNPGHVAQLFADLRLRHLLAPDELADPRRRPLRPVALADRRQRRRHDPPRRHAGVRRQLRRRRLQGQRLLPQLRPRRSDAGGVADAAGRRHPARAGRGERAVRRRHAGRRSGRAATAPSSIAASR